jgi:uncharacterized protein (DUF58 family)
MKYLPPATPTGRVVAGAAVASWIGGWLLGWKELDLVAAGCVCALILAFLFTLGRADLIVGLDTEPDRVTVGQEAVGRLHATNKGGQRILPVRLECPVGAATLRVDVPSLAAGAKFDELFIVPTDRRAVLQLGPVTSVRGDPLGLLRREVVLTEPRQLYVHPRTVRLAGFASGFVRDLEGRATDELSNSDVAFHALREYVIGDDVRHIHWKTSARLGKKMVRQFVDSRRSTLGVLLSASANEYTDEDEFELAVSIVGSLGRSALLDDQQVAMVAGTAHHSAWTPNSLLDHLAGVHTETDDEGLAGVVRRGLPVVDGSAVLVAVSGSAISWHDFRRALARLGNRTAVLGIRVGATSTSEFQQDGALTLMSLGSLSALQRRVSDVGARG